jgi:hypothetical protein
MSVRTNAPHAATRYLVVGGLCGLAWAAGLRGWMAELAGASGSNVTWLTLVLVLLPGTIIGALLGWSAYLRSKGVRGSRWLVFSPVLFASALLDPEIFHGLITDGSGGGALIVIATTLSIGYVLSRRRWSIRRTACAVVAALGLLLIAGMGGMAAPMSTARGAWVSLYGFVLVLLFGLASVLPHPPTRRTLGSRGWIALGTLCGLAWACALREFMAQVAGVDSEVRWVNTFGFILLPRQSARCLAGRSTCDAPADAHTGAGSHWRRCCSPRSSSATPSTSAASSTTGSAAARSAYRCSPCSVGTPCPAGDVPGYGGCRGLCSLPASSRGSSSQQTSAVRRSR